MQHSPMQHTPPPSPPPMQHSPASPPPNAAQPCLPPPMQHSPPPSPPPMQHSPASPPPPMQHSPPPSPPPMQHRPAPPPTPVRDALQQAAGGGGGARPLWDAAHARFPSGAGHLDGSSARISADGPFTAVAGASAGPSSGAPSASSASAPASSGSSKRTLTVRTAASHPAMMPQKARPRNGVDAPREPSRRISPCCRKDPPGLAKRVADDVDGGLGFDAGLALQLNAGAGVRAAEE